MGDRNSRLAEQAALLQLPDLASRLNRNGGKEREYKMLAVEVNKETTPQTHPNVEAINNRLDDHIGSDEHDNSNDE
ncbi:hypothetical protein E4T56_gene12176 [Termitomyces sp. T112]|nr:hypothetical protein E4T56_gene12176 [Termitomyces sp. T112]